VWRSYAPLGSQLSFTRILRWPSQVSAVSRLGGSVLSVEGDLEIAEHGGPPFGRPDLIRETLRSLESRYRSATGFGGATLEGLRLFIFAEADRFEAFLRLLGFEGYLVRGFFLDGRRPAIACFLDGRLPIELQVDLIAHEAAPHLQPQSRRCFREAWLQEGLASYLQRTCSSHREGFELRPLRKLLGSGAHLGFAEMRAIGYRLIAKGVNASPDFDGLCLVAAFYLQSASVVTFLIEGLPEGGAQFRALLAGLRQGRSFGRAFRAAYGREFGDLEPAWGEWLESRSDATDPGLLDAGRLIPLFGEIRDATKPISARARLLAIYSRLAGSAAIPLLEFCAAPENGPLSALARLQLFLQRG